MPIKTVFYIIALIGFSSGSVLLSPIIGIVGYLTAYNINPLGFWWASYVPGIFDRYAMILACSTVIGAIIHKNKFTFKKLIEKQEILFIFFIASIWLSTFVGLDGLSNHANSFKMTKVAIILMIATHLITNYRVYNVIVWVYIISAFYSGFELFFSENLNLVGGRLQSGIGGSDFNEGNFLAIHYLFILPWVGIKFLSGGVKTKVFCIFTAGFVVNALIIIESRGAFLSLGLGALATFFLSPYRYKKKLFVLAFIGAIGFFFLADQTYWERMNTIGFSDSNASYKYENKRLDDSSSGRIEAWKAAIQMFEDHPFGIGEGNFHYLVGNYNPSIPGKDTHNTFLRCLAELGFLGFIILVLMVINYFVILNTISKENKKVTEYIGKLELDIFALRIAFIMFLTGTLFLTHTYIEEFYWLLLFPVFLKRTYENAVQDCKSNQKIA